MPQKKERKPRVNINLEEMEKLLAMQATDAEIAAFFGCTKQAISARKKSDLKFKEAYQRGRDKGKASLRRLMWQKAQGRDNEYLHDDKGQLVRDEKGKAAITVIGFAPDTTMQIFLSKNLLGFTDKQETDITSKGKGLTIAPVFQVIDTETQDLVKRIQNGERTEPVETNPHIQS